MKEHRMIKKGVVDGGVSQHSGVFIVWEGVENEFCGDFG
jgi:hypothetical protein